MKRMMKFMLLVSMFFASYVAQAYSCDGAIEARVVVDRTGTPPPPTKPPESGQEPKGHPDLKFVDDWLEIRATKQESNRVAPNQEITYSYTIENVDSTFEPAHDVYACVWLSDGKKIDDDPKNVGCDKFDNDDLDPREEVHADENFHAPDFEHRNGFNLIACVHENQDKDDFDKAWGCADTAFRFHVDSSIPKATVELRTSGISLVRKSSVQTNEKYGLGAHAWNTGNGIPPQNYRMDYQIEVPKGSNTWQTIDGDTLEPGEILPGASAIWEQMNGDHATAPGTSGTYSIRACVRGFPESCSYGNMSVTPPPPPSVTFTNPHPGEKWKSDRDHGIEWNYSNFPRGEPIRIQYYNMGAWRDIHDAYTTNDGRKVWKMDKSRTKDDHNARLRIIRRSDGKVIGTSHTFFIDRKKGTPKL